MWRFLFEFMRCVMDYSKFNPMLIRTKFETWGSLFISTARLILFFTVSLWLSTRSKPILVQLNTTTSPRVIAISSELTSLPDRLSCVWTFTRDHFLRKNTFLTDLNQRYGLQFNVESNNIHLLLCILLAGDVATNPGPFTAPPRTTDSSPGPDDITNIHYMRCLYFNARSLTNKTSELQTLVTDVDLLAVTETWLKPEIANCELLPGNDFTIHRCDRTERIGGGTWLAVRNTILSVRRKDLESNAEMLVCEIIHPENKKKLLAIVFYRPPDTDLNYIKQLKKSLQLVHNTNKFDQVIICGDFNLPHIDWTTGIATTNDLITNYFTQTIKDNFLWQLVNFLQLKQIILWILSLPTFPIKLETYKGSTTF